MVSRKSSCGLSCDTTWRKKYEMTCFVCNLAITWFPLRGLSTKIRGSYWLSWEWPPKTTLWKQTTPWLTNRIHLVVRTDRVPLAVAWYALRRQWFHTPRSSRARVHVSETCRENAHGNTSQQQIKKIKFKFASERWRSQKEERTRWSPEFSPEYVAWKGVLLDAWLFTTYWTLACLHLLTRYSRFSQAKPFVLLFAAQCHIHHRLSSLQLRSKTTGLWAWVRFQSVPCLDSMTSTEDRSE